MLYGPAILTLLFCPAILYTKEPLMKWFFPDGQVGENLNDALSVFLAPSGLVYALTFGFSYQIAMDKFKEVCGFLSVPQHPPTNHTLGGLSP